MSQIHFSLVDWYRVSKRDLPFRMNRDPYRVWISEIMAQQTQIDTLVPYYLRWMKRFPSLADLASAPLDDVLKAWEGLGYYSRARNLHTAALAIQAQGGQFPMDLESIRSLKGIGEYTASAIASICFDTKTAAIDGNVKRVMSRLMLWDETELKKHFTENINETIERWMNDVPPHELTQALMELGALVCTKQARCEICPLKEECLAYQANAVQAYPKPKAKTLKKTEEKDVVLLLNENNEFALTLHHKDSLMKGYYRLPELDQLNEILPIKKDQDLTHVFSHKIWNVHFFTAKTNQNIDGLEWVSFKDRSRYPIITLHRRYLDEKALEIDF